MEIANKLVLQVRAQSFVQWSVVSKMHFEVSLTDQSSSPQAHFTFVLGDDDKGWWCRLQHKLLCQLL